jgi:hypothetical protein
MEAQGGKDKRRYEEEEGMRGLKPCKGREGPEDGRTQGKGRRQGEA